MINSSKLSNLHLLDCLKRLVHESVFMLIGLKDECLGKEYPVSLEAGIESIKLSGSKGEIRVSSDGIRVVIEASYGDLPVLRLAIRDRLLDGTKDRSPLTAFPNSDPACNRLAGPGFKCAELSVYSWNPCTYLDGSDRQGTLAHFLTNPDYYIWENFQAQVFFPLWAQAFYAGRAPWQMARPMSFVPVHFVRQAEALLTELGYHRVDAVPSWYNVAVFFEKLGYGFTYGEHESAYLAIKAGLGRFEGLSMAQCSWLVALQNLPEAFVPAQLKLPARWPVTHTNMYWVRMHKDLNSFKGSRLPYRTELMESIILQAISSAHGTV